MNIRIPAVYSAVLLAVLFSQPSCTTDEYPQSSEISSMSDSNSYTKKENKHGTRLPPPTDDIIAQLPEDGGKEFNRLVFESSPYLLQHSRNPINWYPWGEEAFARAKKEDKPIFLSIGYTTCHWCHVMEHESFEDHEVAGLINEEYICVKVDREERPDVDHVYMSVTQMMTGRGGWPMTVIMSPEKVPFFAGTYFPKSSMIDLLPHFARVWKEQRGKAREVGQAIVKSLQEMQQGLAGGDLNATHLDACFLAMQRNFEPKYGGFGKSPKFPTCHSLSFLLRYYQRSNNQAALEMVEKTLREIRLGGIYDQVGFGIHRYSTDSKWLVPHFEKMLYDQALFVIANLECFQVTGNQFYLDSCRDTLAYVARDLTSEEGGFYSAEDADSEGEEGKFYVWSLAELRDALGQGDADLFAEIFQFEKSGNYLDEVTHKKTGSNIPHLRFTIQEISLQKQMSTVSLNERMEKIRTRLFKFRKTRIHPQKDDKVLTDWNGLMISAFSRSARVLHDNKLLLVAKKAADFCLRTLKVEEGRLLKRWRRGKSGLPAHLEDYAFFAQGLLDLYEASLEARYLKEAKQIIDFACKHFQDREKGGFFLTADDGEKLLVRSKEIYDGAIPSGNSVMALNLVRLAKFTGQNKYKEIVHDLFSAFSGFLKKNPQGAEVLLQALDFELSSALEIVVCGSLEDGRTKKLLNEINQRFLPAKVLLNKPTDSNSESILGVAPYLENYQQIKDTPTVFVCRNQTCQKPQTEPAGLAKQLALETKPD